MHSFNSALPVFSAVKAMVTGRSDTVLPCCGKLASEAHAPSCNCRQELPEKLYSMKEVSQHCDPQSCWVVVDNAVYDLTDFIYDHPGGMELMLEHAGTDCTGAFQDVGHSRFAVQWLQKYRIGMLNPEERITL